MHALSAKSLCNTILKSTCAFYKHIHFVKYTQLKSDQYAYWSQLKSDQYALQQG